MIHLKDKFKIFFSNKVVVWSIVSSVFVNIIIGYLIYKNIDFSKTSHVLHYNYYFGIDLVDTASKILYIPLISVLLFFCNLAFAFVSYTRRNDFFISNILIFAALFIDIELLTYLIGIISIEY